MSLVISCRIARPQPSLSKVKGKITHLGVRVDTRLSQHQVRSISLCSNDPHPLPLPSQKTKSSGCHGRNYVGEHGNIAVPSLQHVIIFFEPPPTLHSYIPIQPPPPPLFFHQPPTTLLHPYPSPSASPPPTPPVPRQAQTRLGVMEGTTLSNLVKSHHHVSWILPYGTSPPYPPPPPTTLLPPPPPPHPQPLQTSTNSLGCHGRHHVVEPGEVAAPSLLDLVVLLQPDEAVTPQCVTTRVARARLAQLPRRLDGSLQEDEDVELLLHHIVRPHAVEGRVRGYAVRQRQGPD